MFSYFVSKKLLFFLVLIVTALLAAGCASSKAESKLAPLADMPQSVQDSALTVQTAYRFAAANPEVMKQVPCYCGCGPMGHTSNYSCYIRSAQENEDGASSFDTHALGCGICVDITLDTKRMLEEGNTVDEIRAKIDQEYSRFGPSNMP
jgi:hypothetical protein